MKIPLIDLERQYMSIFYESNRAVLEVLKSAKYIMGENVKKFEEEFSAYLGVKHSISVGNGTDALVIALKALGIGEGDEVITTPFTFFATAESIASVGARPVFVDVNRDTFNIDPSKIEEKITDKTKAIMPVHIFGQPCEMDLINNIARKHGIKVIEDACQAVGSEYDGYKIGTLSDIACFSFFPTKNLGCAGDGGMIVTNNDNLATLCRALRAHGSGENGENALRIINGEEFQSVDEETTKDNTVYNPNKYYNYIIGHNSRLDEIQASLLRIKLQKLDEWNQKRASIAKVYMRELREINVEIPFTHPKAKHVYHMFIVQSDNRDKMINYLNQNGIATGTYYPVPLHLQKAFKYLDYSFGDLPNAEYLSQRTFAIPMFPELTDEEIDYIINTIRKFGD